MDNYFKYHKGYQEGYRKKTEVFKYLYLRYKKDLKKYLGKFEDAKVLEIGSGLGKFAYFCSKIGVRDYTGIDIDDFFFDENKKDFPNYNFVKIGFQEYLKNHENQFDIIFVSHVFEHLDEIERVEMVESIYSGLKVNGMWINYMPNADTICMLGNGRWTDITHKTIYNDMSFSQVVYNCDCNFEIENFNSYIGLHKFTRLIHLIFRFFTNIYFYGMTGFGMPKLYTWEFINVLTKKCKN